LSLGARLSVPLHILSLVSTKARSYLMLR
jgi:hypothetical protein